MICRLTVLRAFYIVIYDNSVYGVRMLAVKCAWSVAKYLTRYLLQSRRMHDGKPRVKVFDLYTLQIENSASIFAAVKTYFYNRSKMWLINTRVNY